MQECVKNANSSQAGFYKRQLDHVCVLAEIPLLAFF
jgi:hypothetical protein